MSYIKKGSLTSTDEDRKIKSINKSLFLGYHTKNFSILFDQIEAEGFKTENSDHFSEHADLPNDAYFPNMKMRYRSYSIFGSLFPEKFSILALINQTERQENYGGSFIYHFEIARGELENSNNRIYPFNSELSGTSFSFMTPRIGYGYSLVMYNFHTSFAILPNLFSIYSNRIKRINNTDKTTNSIKHITNFSFFGGFGYNNGKFNVGFSLFNSSHEIEYANISISPSRRYLQFYIGYNI